MNKYVERMVERALGEAQSGVVPPEPDTLYTRYLSYHDNDSITLNNFRHTPYQASSAIVDASRHTLRELFAAYSALTDQPLSPSFIDYYAHHEAEHAVCAQKLGAVAILYGLSFARAAPNPYGITIEIEGAFTVARQLETTKLGAAILSIYPTHPSKDDLRDAQTLGYCGPEDIAERARTYNREGWRYPIPLSSQPPVNR